jgi:polysaccharide biosynthesis/export protein
MRSLSAVTLVLACLVGGDMRPVSALQPGLLDPGAAAPQAARTDTTGQRPQPQKLSTPPADDSSGSRTVVTDPDFTIGPEDVLGVLVWRELEVSGDVTVRPDGMITLPLIRDVKAAGMTPAALADRIQTSLREYITDASVTVVVRQLNSRKVFITGEVVHPGSYRLNSSMTVMQLIALAGGLTEFADARNLSIRRTESGRQTAIPFDYKNVVKGKNAEQNILLKPGDMVVVPEG